MQHELRFGKEIIRVLTNFFIEGMAPMDLRGLIALIALIDVILIDADKKLQQEQWQQQQNRIKFHPDRKYEFFPNTNP